MQIGMILFYGGRKMAKMIGFIGLGIMGRPMALNLLKAGYPIVAYDINRESVESLVAAGAQAEASCAAVAGKSEVVITMLPNSPHVREAVFGVNGVAEGARAGMILIDMSSIDPNVSIEIAKELEEKSIEMLDAPVSGGEPKAIDGTLSIMVGGKQAVFDKVEEILLKMGSSAVLVGDIGSGNVTKLANQIIVALNIAAVSEAFVMASKAGIDPTKLFDAIKGGLAGSAVMNAKAQNMIDNTFVPGFRTELHVKDLTKAMDFAHKLGTPLPLASQVLEMFESLQTAGKGKLDHSVLVQIYEKLANMETAE
jgi:2-hydroxy-3-oxopropionate reductase